jgi:hypothetical protein
MLLHAQRKYSGFGPFSGKGTVIFNRDLVSETYQPKATLAVAIKNHGSFPARSNPHQDWRPISRKPSRILDLNIQNLPSQALYITFEDDDFVLRSPT